MESDLPNFDLPSDYIVGKGYGINLLKRYKNFPCRVKAGFFILCVKGIMQATINGNLQNIGENDLITLPPGYFMEILDFSPVFTGYSYLLCRVLIRIHRGYKSNEVYRTSSPYNYGKSDNKIISIAGLQL